MPQTSSLEIMIGNRNGSFREIIDNRKVKLEWVTKDYQLADVLIKKELQMSDL